MKKLTIAAMADLHTNEDCHGYFRQIFSNISKKADILLLCGDLTQDGLLEEAEILADELSSCRIPVLGILGNHDYTNNNQNKINKILSDRNMRLLNNSEPFIYKEVGFTGVKGFCGGFDEHLTEPFGERVLKEFVTEAVNETIKLERFLTKLETKRKVVMLHYAPIRETVAGESPEIYPMLGTSRLIEPINNFNVTAVFHGHAHHGSPEGKTIKGIPVYNVSFPLRKEINPLMPYVIIEV